MAESLSYHFDFVNSKRKCFVFHNLPIPPRFGYFSLVSIFTYCLTIAPCWFCKFEFEDEMCLA